MPLKSGQMAAHKNHLNFGHKGPHLKLPSLQWSGTWLLVKLNPFKNRTIEIFKKSGFWMFLDFVWSDFQELLNDHSQTVLVFRHIRHSKTEQLILEVRCIRILNIFER